MIFRTVWPRTLQQRIDAWMYARQPRSDSQRLTHHNVYILPTKAGFFFMLTMGVLLLASINYQLNLGYALTFLLSGSALVSMHLTHATLRGLTLNLRPFPPTFANRTAHLEAVLQDAANGGRDRFGVGLRLRGWSRDAASWTDIPAGGQTLVSLSFTPKRRGWHHVPHWIAETHFPLGLFRSWTLWRPGTKVLVYPEPETPSPTLPYPASTAWAGQSSAAPREGRGEMDGVRTYRRGDPVKSIVWKKAAKAMASGADLVSRDTQAVSQAELWLDWRDCHDLSAEARLSRLAAWVLLADQMDVNYGLRLPNLEIPPDAGDMHRHQALEALALWS